MKRFIYILLLVQVNCLKAQNTFVKSINTSNGLSLVASCIRTTTDNGYIITGYENINVQNWSPFLIRLDSLGDTLWVRSFNFTGQNNSCYAQQTNDGGFVMVGKIGNPIYLGFYIGKTDSTGNLVWLKNYIPHGSMPTSPFYFQQTSDHGYIVGGVAEKLSYIKLDSLGTVIWEKFLLDTNLTPERIRAGQQTFDGGYIFTGKNYKSPGNPDIILIKSDSSGDTVWTRTYGGLGYEEGNSVLQTSDSGYLVSGTFNSAYTILLKTDPMGDTLWSRVYKDTLNNSMGGKVLQTLDGGFLVMARSHFPTMEIYLLKTDSIGTLIWSKFFDAGYNIDNINGLEQSSDGGFIITGLDTLLNTLIIKTDAAGNTICNSASAPNIITSNPSFEVKYPSLLDFNWSVPQDTVTFQQSNNAFFVTGCFTSLNEEIQNASSHMIVFPNPVENQLSISSDLNVFQIDVFNAVGKRVPIEAQNYKSKGRVLLINVSSFDQGIYILNVYTNQGVLTKKFVKL